MKLQANKQNGSCNKPYNNSIEQTCYSKLRLLPKSTHVKR